MNITVVALIGRPNFGKSAIFNRSSGKGGATVTGAGTTRDGTSVKRLERRKVSRRNGGVVAIRISQERGNPNKVIQAIEEAIS